VISTRGNAARSIMFASSGRFWVIDRSCQDEVRPAAIDTWESERLAARPARRRRGRNLLAVSLSG
jgi:hypothetical protein